MREPLAERGGVLAVKHDGHGRSEESSMRTQICEAAVEERRIDVLLEDIEHGVDEADQFVQGGDRLFYVAIGDGVEQGDVDVNRLLQILAAREFGVIEPADTSENR